MKKLTQKLVLSVITMALVVVALGTSTFAWFTLTNSASVQQFHAQITAGEGIEVSVGTWNSTSSEYELLSTSLWFTVLPSSVIQQYIVNEYGGSLAEPTFTFSDVTSTNGVAFTTYDLDTNTPDTAPASSYLSITLYFRSATAKDIVWSSATLGGGTKDWDVNVDTFVQRTGQSYGTDVVGYEQLPVAAWTAARVSVTGLVGTASGVSTTAGYQAPADTDGPVYNSQADIASYDLQGTGPYTLGGGAYGAGSYAEASGKTLSLTATPTVFATDSTLGDKVLTLIDGALLAEPDYFGGSVVVNVWIEGWDADTYDAIFDTQLFVQLGFTTATASV